MQQYVVRACDELHRHNVYLFRRNALHHAGIAALCLDLLPQILDDGGNETARLNRDELDHIRGSRSTERRNSAEARRTTGRCISSSTASQCESISPTTTTEGGCSFMADPHDP